MLDLFSLACLFVCWFHRLIFRLKVLVCEIRKNSVSILIIKTMYLESKTSCFLWRPNEKLLEQTQKQPMKMSYIFNSSLLFPPAWQILRHYPGSYCRGLTTAHSWQPNMEPLVSERKLLSSIINFELFFMKVLLLSDQNVSISKNWNSFAQKRKSFSLFITDKTDKTYFFISGKWNLIIIILWSYHSMCEPRKISRLFEVFSYNIQAWDFARLERLIDNPSRHNNRNTRIRCEIYSELPVKTPERRQWRRSGVFLLTLNIFHTLF